MDFAPAESFAADAFAGVPRVIAIASVEVCRERPCHALGGVRAQEATTALPIAIAHFPPKFVRRARRADASFSFRPRRAFIASHLRRTRALRREGSKRDRPRTFLRAMQSGLRHRYRRLEDDSDAPSQGSDPRFAVPDHLDPRKKPPKKRQVVLAFGLLVVGSALLMAYALYATGHLVIPKNEERGTSLAILILGCMTFAPGAYVSLIITLARLGVPGVDYSMVP